jgi:hypothetical protein
MKGLIDICRIPIHVTGERLDIFSHMDEVVIFEARVFLAKHPHHGANELPEKRFCDLSSSLWNRLTGKPSNQPENLKQ